MSKHSSNGKTIITQYAKVWVEISHGISTLSDAKIRVSETMGQDGIEALIDTENAAKLYILLQRRLKKGTAGVVEEMSKKKTEALETEEDAEPMWGVASRGVAD